MSKFLTAFLLFSASCAFAQSPFFIAHRGGALLAPENTLAAFQNAVDFDADYFELDVKISSDDSLMIMHDVTVDRTTNGTGNIAELTYAELRALDAGSWFGAEFAEEKIPTLFEALNLAASSENNIGVVVELKSTDPRVPRLVTEMIQKFGFQSRAIVSSFSLSRLAEVKSIDSSIPVMFFAAVSSAVIDQVAEIGGDWVGGNSATEDLVDYAHAKGIQVNIFSLNAIRPMLRLIDLGVDALSTDDLNVLVALRDETPPDDVVLTAANSEEARVSLSWEASQDLESGIGSYDIYRGTEPAPTDLLESIENFTVYTDLTAVGNEQYYYRIKARNQVGITSVNYSNELRVVASPDTTNPTLLSVSSATDPHTIVVEFSETVDQNTAENTDYYQVSGGVSIVEAALSLDQRSVILSTSPMDDVYYVLFVKGIQDMAVTPNVMPADTTIFRHSALLPETVALYDLDNWVEGDETTILDASTNGNHGVVKGGAFITDGYIGNSLRFNGAEDYVQLPASESFDLNSNTVTLAVWTKLDFLPSEMTTPFGPIFDSDDDQYVIYEDRGNEELRFKVTTTNSAERPGIPESSLPKGDWIHVVGVYNGRTAKVYLNGVEMDSHNITGRVRTGQEARLGKSGNPNSSSHFTGNIDNVEVYNLALSANEVMDLYRSYKQSNLSVCEPVTIQEAATICAGESYTFPDGSSSSETIMNSSLAMEDGCFGIVNTVLEVTGVNTNVSQRDSVLLASQSDATYQWLECNDGYAVIDGATAISFTPSPSSSYAVEVSYRGCVDTSECVSLSTTSIRDAQVADFNLYPNPSTGSFKVAVTSSTRQPYWIEIFDSVGRLIFTGTSRGADKAIVLDNVDAGIYSVKTTSEEVSHVQQLLIY